MSTPIQLLDGGGTKHKAKVTERGELSVSLSDIQIPSSGAPSRQRYLNSLLGSTGADSGTTSMNVDGSVTAQEFYIASSPDYDIRIMQILIYIADASVLNKNFGDISPLSNGWTLKITEAGVDTNFINSAKTTGEVIVQTNANIFAPSAASQGNVLTEVDASSNQAAVILLDVGSLVPWGMRVGRGTKDRVTSVINDDLTALSDFLVRIFGYRHYP